MKRLDCLNKSAQKAGYTTELIVDKKKLNIAINEEQIVSVTISNEEDNDIISIWQYVCQINTNKADEGTIDLINKINTEVSEVNFHIGYIPDDNDPIKDMVVRMDLIPISEDYLSRMLPHVIDILLEGSAYCKEHFQDKARC
jgi:hypothetical protein